MASVFEMFPAARRVEASELEPFRREMEGRTIPAILAGRRRRVNLAEEARRRSMAVPCVGGCGIMVADGNCCESCADMMDHGEVEVQLDLFADAVLGEPA